MLSHTHTIPQQKAFPCHPLPKLSINKQIGFERFGGLQSLAAWSRTFRTERTKPPSFERTQRGSSTLSDLYQMRLENAQLVGLSASSCPALLVVDSSKAIVRPDTGPEQNVKFPAALNQKQGRVNHQNCHRSDKIKDSTDSSLYNL